MQYLHDHLKGFCIGVPLSLDRRRRWRHCGGGGRSSHLAHGKACEEVECRRYEALSEGWCGG